MPWKQLAYALHPFLYRGKTLIASEVFEVLTIDEWPLRTGAAAPLPPGAMMYLLLHTRPFRLHDERHFLLVDPPDQVYRLVQTGERVTEAHPDFGVLYDNYRSNPRPNMIPEAVYEALHPAPERPGDPPPRAVVQPALATDTSETVLPSATMPTIPHRLHCYLSQESFTQALSQVIDTFLKQPLRLGYPSRSTVTDPKHDALWPDKLRPDRRQLYNLLKFHHIDYKAFVEARRTLVVPVRI